MTTSSQAGGSTLIDLRSFKRLRAVVAWVRNVTWHCWEVWKGVRPFLSTGDTPHTSLHHLICLFCKTRGISNELLHAALKLRHRPYSLHSTSGVLGKFTPNDINQIGNAIREEGYYVFPQRLPEDVVDQLAQVARTAMTSPDEYSGPEVVYDPKSPVSTRYVIYEKSIIQQPIVQKVASDMMLTAVAQNYLKLPPILDIVSMAISIPFGHSASSPSAQLYHFDMDRIRWLKFFIYLNDVDSENGPHCVIRKTHKPFHIPGSLLSYHYARITDEELSQHYSPSEFVEIVGKRGSIVAVDTRAFHKGKHPVKGERLLMQIEFSDCLFGAEYAKSAVKADPASQFYQHSLKYPRVYSKFRFNAP